MMNIELLKVAKKLIRKNIFEIILFVFVAVVLFLQEDFSRHGPEGYILTMVSFSLTLFLICWFRSSVLKTLENVKFSFQYKNFISLPSLGKIFYYCISGSLASFILAVSELFSVFLFYAKDKPTHLGIPFRFLPLEGGFLFLPFFTDSLFFTVIFFLHNKLSIGEK